MNKKLKIARKEYPKGTLFLSATGNLTAPISVNLLKISESYNNTISNESGGIIYMEDENGAEIWAKKV